MSELWQSGTHEDLSKEYPHIQRENQKLAQRANLLCTSLEMNDKNQKIMSEQFALMIQQTSKADDATVKSFLLSAHLSVKDWLVQLNKMYLEEAKQWIKMRALIDNFWLMSDMNYYDQQIHDTNLPLEMQRQVNEAVAALEIFCADGKNNGYD